MPGVRSTLPAVILLSLTLATAASAQAPGEYPRMVVSDADSTVPPANGPFDNTNTFVATSGSSFALQLSYEAVAQPNTQVIWALLLSLQPTPFAKDVLPPLLLPAPPFQLVFPSPPTLDVQGEAQVLVAVPAGFDGLEVYLQALVQDTTSVPSLQLSNGTRLLVASPDYNVRFSYVRAAPSTGHTNLGGVATEDIDGDTLKTFVPLGTEQPPFTHVDDIGLPAGFTFLPLLPNVHDSGPVNVHARPITRLKVSAPLGNETVLTVDDTSYFPSQGLLYVARQGANLFDNRTGLAPNIQTPAVEVVRYRSKGPDSFRQCSRVQLGSTNPAGGSVPFPHSVGDMVLGEFTLATTTGALSRDRVSVDARNPDLPHLVLPEVTFTGPEGQVTQELDVYLYQRLTNTTTGEGVQGFLVLDRTTQTWRRLAETEIDSSSAVFWDPMVHVSPDHRFLLACKRRNTPFGPGTTPWPNYDPDELWALRLDGLDWPASGSPVWRIEYELQPDPIGDQTNVRSRRIHMPSVAIVGPDPDNWVAYVGLAHKMARTASGTNFVVNEYFEGFYFREQTIVRDYIEAPLVPPGSAKLPPSMPRPYITSAFPSVGPAEPITRFDPLPFVSPDRRSLFLVGGAPLSDGSPAEKVEDVYRIRNVQITPTGQVSRSILNLTGFGAEGAVDAGTGEVTPFDRGTHGLGGKVDLSPDGTLLAFVRYQSNTLDWVQIARVGGSDFGSVGNVFDSAPGANNFNATGPLNNVRRITGVRWVDNDRLVWLMGRLDDRKPLEPPASSDAPGMDVFLYTRSTNSLVNLTRTGTGAGDPDFGSVGSIRPAGYFESKNGDYWYVLRDGISSQSGKSLPADTNVLNVIAVHGASATAFDITGTELGLGALVGDLDVPTAELQAPVETAASLGLVEGSGTQEGLLYFAAHALVGNGADHVVGFSTESPFVAFQATTTAPVGAHVSNITPNPHGSTVAFARTFTTNRLGASQHPFVVDLDAFLFVRDLTPNVVDANGPTGRVMDGSFQFVAPSGSAGDALVFAMGSGADPESGVALQTGTVYYPLVNVSNTLAEPVPVLLPLLSTLGLGPGYRIYVTSAGPSQQ